MRINKFLLAAGFTAAIAMPAFGQGSPAPSASASTANKAPSSQEFVKKAAMTNMFEIKAGHIAEQKTKNSKVDSYAKMIINDHQKMQNKLQSMAKNVQGAKIPQKLDQAHQTKINQLQQASGAKFLKTFKQQQVQGHEKGVSMFKAYAQHGQNAHLKQLAKNGVPVLKKHLRHAQNLPTSTGAPTVGAGSHMNKGTKGSNMGSGANR